MKPLPSTEDPLVIRTDFTDDAAWREIQRSIGAPVGDQGFLAHVTFVDDRAFDGADSDELLPLLTAARPFHGFAMLVDRMAISAAEHPLLVLDLFEPGHAFRAIPATVQSIENNLSISNMDFEEFADSVGSDGVFRGFA